MESYYYNEYEYAMDNYYNIMINTTRYYYSLVDIAVSLSLLLPLRAADRYTTILGSGLVRRNCLSNPWRIDHR